MIRKILDWIFGAERRSGIKWNNVEKIKGIITLGARPKDNFLKEHPSLEGKEYIKDQWNSEPIITAYKQEDIHETQIDKKIVERDYIKKPFMVDVKTGEWKDYISKAKVKEAIDKCVKEEEWLYCLLKELGI